MSGGESPTAESVLNALAEKIPKESFCVEVQEEQLFLSDKNPQKSNLILLSENMTTQTVSSLINFETQDYGKYKLPENSITQIVTNRI